MSAQGQDHATAKAQEAPRWLDKPGNTRRSFVALMVVCGGLLVWDLLYHQHGHLGFDEIFGFHAAFGFVAYCCIVGTAVQLRKFLKRDEDYYGE